MMFSLEAMLEITGDVQWADHIERIAYNALPTQATDEFSARQYYQQVNHVQITRDIRNFSTPHEDTDLLFGELSGYPCCTSNMHQSWPKLTQRLWFATSDNGLGALLYAPSSVTAKVAAVVERGPLIYALKMNETWEKKTDERQDYSEWYYEVTSDSPWNYCLPRRNLRPEALNEAFVVEKSPAVAPYPWTLKDAPVTIRTKARRILRWQLYNASAGPIQYHTQSEDRLGEEETIELIPYGCTTLRVTEFPVR